MSAASRASSPSDASLLPLGAATRLLAAFVSARATRTGARAFVLKGHAASAQGLRQARASVDVDVWVDPGMIDAFLNDLHAFGWHRRRESYSWEHFIDHSVTLVHDRWPCDLDVHVRFPGVFVEPAVAFARLWERSTDLTVDGTVIRAPDAADHFVLLALHALRDPRSNRASVDRADLVRHARALGPSFAERVAEASDRLGARASAAEVLHAVGVPTAPLTPPRTQEELLWLSRRTVDRHVFHWVYHVLATPPSQRLRVALRGLIPRREDIEANRAYDDPVRGRFQYVMRRFVRFTRNVPRLVPLVRHALAVHRLTTLQRPTTARPQMEASSPAAAGAPALQLPLARPRVEQASGPSVTAASSIVVGVGHGDSVFVVSVTAREHIVLAARDGAAALWLHLLTHGATRAECVAHMQADYGIPRPKAERFVAAFEETIMTHGFPTIDAMAAARGAGA